MLTEDLSVFLADFGVPTVFGEITSLALLDMPDQPMFDGAQMATEYAITYPKAVFPGLKNGDLVTVDGDNYKVSGKPVLLDDGKFIKASLKK